MNIEEIDKNFKTEVLDSNRNLEYLDVRENCFSLFGVFYEDGCFRRLPKSLASSLNEGIEWLHTNTAGGRACFRTNSTEILLRCKLPQPVVMAHQAQIGTSGFDLYAYNEKNELHFVKSFQPDYRESSYEAYLDLADCFGCDKNEMKSHRYLLNFPTYNGVQQLILGFTKGCSIEPFNPYEGKGLPVVFYGSSITQGGCASRPGNTYQAVLSRRMGFDYWNLGFSGNCKAEVSMMEYLAGLPMSVFVYDYDHNAPDANFLHETHERGYRMMREKNPDLPIVFVTRPDWSNDHYDRWNEIKATYDHAVAEGDRNVYFVDGMEMLHYLDPDMMTVDGTHPTDFGFYCMASVLEKTLQKLLP